MAVKDVTKAVIPAAGLGTRFLPATKATPKEMLPVVDKPAIQYVVEEAVAAGLDDVPVDEHAERLSTAHSALQEVLRTPVDHAPAGRPSPGPRP